MAVNRCAPTFNEEKALRKQGYQLVAGVDEVGRGALVGPVVAAAVILPHGIRPRWGSRVRDSKQLDAPTREELDACIRDKAIAFGIGCVPPDVIDAEGILNATRRAMREAIGQLAPAPDYLLIDYLRLTEVALPQQGIKFGDSLCFTIACASIIAKVARDRLMVELDETYPAYGLAAHKGYGTRQHLESLRKHGPCPLHRCSFRPVQEALLESSLP